MRKVFKFLSLSLASLATVTNCQTINMYLVNDQEKKIDVSNILNKMKDSTYDLEIKPKTNKEEFINFLDLFVVNEFLALSLEKEDLSINMIKQSIYWLMSKENRKIFSWEENQETWQEITNNQGWLNSVVEEDEKNLLKISFKNSENDVDMIFNFLTVEKSKEEIQVLINNFNFEEKFFTWYFSKIFNNCNHLFTFDSQDSSVTNLNIDTFNNNFVEHFKKFFFLSAFSFIEDSTFVVVNIKNNGHKLTQEDLNRKGQLNLTVDYELKIDGEVLKGTTMWPLKINLTK